MLVRSRSRLTRILWVAVAACVCVNALLVREATVHTHDLQLLNAHDHRDTVGVATFEIRFDEEMYIEDSNSSVPLHMLQHAQLDRLNGLTRVVCDHHIIDSHMVGNETLHGNWTKLHPLVTVPPSAYNTPNRSQWFAQYLVTHVCEQDRPCQRRLWPEDLARCEMHFLSKAAMDWNTSYSLRGMSAGADIHINSTGFRPESSLASMVNFDYVSNDLLSRAGRRMSTQRSEFEPDTRFLEVQESIRGTVGIGHGMLALTEMQATTLTAARALDLMLTSDYLSMTQGLEMMCDALCFSASPVIAKNVGMVTKASLMGAVQAKVDEAYKDIAKKGGEDWAKFLTPATVIEGANAVHEALFETASRTMHMAISMQLKRTAARTLARALTRGLTEVLTLSLSYILTKVIVEVLQVTMIRLLSHQVANHISPPLVHSIVPAVTHAMTRTPAKDYYCYYCDSTNAYCDECAKAEAKDYFEDYYTNYYTSYFEHYYTYHYGGKYTDDYVNHYLKKEETDDPSVKMGVAGVVVEPPAKK